MGKKEKQQEEQIGEQEVPVNSVQEAGNEQHESGSDSTVAELQKKLAEANEQHLRLLAEFDNFRKRSRREMDILREYASETVLVALLPVLDDLDRTMTAMEKTDNLASIQTGMRLVTEKLHNTLEKEGLNIIQAAGAPFDSELHEAIHSMSVDEDKKGMVLDVVEKGYRLKDRVIRYSKVVVGE